MVDPLVLPRFDEPWSAEILSWSDSKGRLRLRHNTGRTVSIELQRCARGRLRHSYPVAAHDIEVRVLAVNSAEELTAILRAVVVGIREAEPSCRKIVYAVGWNEAQHGTISALATVAAAEAANFRYVVDVDIADAELGLLVAEPAWVTAVDIDLGDVLGS
jgi:hypothetical protein